MTFLRYPGRGRRGKPNTITMVNPERFEVGSKVVYGPRLPRLYSSRRMVVLKVESDIVTVRAEPRWHQVVRTIGLWALTLAVGAIIMFGAMFVLSTPYE